MRFMKGSVASASSERKRKKKKVHEDDSADSGSEREEENDWAAFLNFFSTETNKSTDVNDDEEADPEFNIHEAEEEDNDDWRRDASLKISKKELNELLAELENFDLPVPDEINNEQVDAGKENRYVVQCQSQEVQVDQNQIFQESFGEEQQQAPVQPVQESSATAIEEEDRPLISDLDRQKILYQLQHHVQLLCQTYVLTASREDEVSRDLSTQSRRMIAELNIFAKSSNPKSCFLAKNIPYANTLVCTWPPVTYSKSPIKKKILEERYMNEAVPSTGKNCFTRNIIKTIAESPAFMYPELLPHHHNLISLGPIHFFESEDALIAVAYVEMLNNPVYAAMKIRERSRIISKTILPGRPSYQIANRIKNASRKSQAPEARGLNEEVSGTSLVKLHYYITNKAKPPSPLDSWTPEMMEMEPIAPIKRESLPGLWVSLISKWQIDMAYTPVSNSPSKKKDDSPAVRKRKSASSRKLNETDESSSKKKIASPVARKRKSANTSKLNETDGSMKFRNIRKSEMKKNNFSTLETTTAAVTYSDATLDDAEKIQVRGHDGEVAAYILVPRMFIPSPSTSGLSSKPDESLSRNASSTSVVMGNTVHDELETYDDAENGSKSPEADVADSIEQSRQELSKNAVEHPVNTKGGSNRSDNSARTWVYVRKTPAEIAATITKKLRKIQYFRSPRKRTESCTNKTAEKTKRKYQLSRSRSSNSIHMSSEQDSFADPAETGDGDVNSAKGESTNGSQGCGDTNSGSSQSKATETGAAATSSINRAGNRNGSAGRDSDDDDNIRRNSKNIPASKLCEGERDEETDEYDKEEPSDSPQRNFASHPDVSKTFGKLNKRTKKSPQQKKRASKYKIAEIQKLLDDAEAGVNMDEIETAFAEEFWNKCQHSLDPVLYNNLIQSFVDFGDPNNQKVSEDEIFSKAQEILKDYPDLLVDLATMIDPQILQKNNLLRDNYSFQAHIRFMHLLEKLTEQCPQIKSRVLQKVKSMRDKGSISENDVLELVDLYFHGNPIMCDSLKAMFPALFPPESIVRDEDFEDINLDEEPVPPEEGNMETINLPEEANVPATSSCPCECHSDAQTLSFSTRAKHCRKCCIKFQDGKVYMLHGRVMKQVNISFTSKENAEQILAGYACSHCFKPVSCPPEASTKPFKKRLSRTMLLSDNESETEVRRTNSGVVVADGGFSTGLQSSNKPTDKSSFEQPVDDVEEGEIVDDEESQLENDLAIARKKAKLDSRESADSGTGKGTSEEICWTFEEDAVFLRYWGKQEAVPDAVERIMKDGALQHRSADEVRQRLEQIIHLMSTKQRSKH